MAASKKPAAQPDAVSRPQCWSCLAVLKQQALIGDIIECVMCGAKSRVIPRQ